MTEPRLRAVTIYCSSSNSLHPEFFGAARELGERLARSGRTMVYGGGRVGLMGEAARACRAAGGRVVGVITQTLRDAEQMDPDNDENIIVDTMRERKRIMEQRCDAMMVLPGGLGTMEEFFEVLVGRLLGEHDKPIIIVNQADPNHQHTDQAAAEALSAARHPGRPPGFYDPLLSMIDHMIDNRFAKAGVKSLFSVRDTPAEAVALLDELERAPAAPTDRRRLVPSAKG